MLYVQLTKSTYLLLYFCKVIFLLIYIHLLRVVFDLFDFFTFLLLILLLFYFLLFSCCCCCIRFTSMIRLIFIRVIRLRVGIVFGLILASFFGEIFCIFRWGVLRLFWVVFMVLAMLFMFISVFLLEQVCQFKFLLRQAR